MNIKTIVGLEIHAQLNSKTKAFCTCLNDNNLEPNTATCPGCLGMPGALPIINKEVVRLAIKAGLAFNCDINKESTFERKKYFYPDLPKGYQITQSEIPICSDGYIEVDDINGNIKKINIERIQIEEDTGKSLHSNDGFVYMDYNRSGAPLIEIITKPDINSAKEAKEFLIKLRNTLTHLGVNDGKMEDGSLRCDVNVNIENIDNSERTSIIEIKNINSFSAVEKTIEFEINRQIKLLENGEMEIRSTRRWDDSIGETVLMREKLSADDYMYSQDGDIPNLVVSEELVDEIRKSMPELIDERKERLVREYNITEYEANILSSDTHLSNYFEEVAKKIDNYELISNYIINDLLRRMNDGNISIDELKFTQEEFADLLNFLDKDEINNNTAKKVFRLMFEEGINPSVYIKENNLIQIADTSEIENYVIEVLSENPDSIKQYLEGKDRILGFLVGQVMKKSKGKANPVLVNELLIKEIKNHQ
ncbi:MAG: Asp-tRNA(Asn)/Glu-tRNA(Gln) amidotransferase subunit GatB [Tissierellia bacterium]|nr:Asp-tRNA(Asn)/Glu-tRNA(Gln) amidotransferase subunit GatB [Tissierellia bacterium]